MTGPERRDEKTLSLMEQLRQSYKTDGTATIPLENEAPPAFTLPDGYVRRTPVQPYVEEPGYRRKRILRIIYICAVAALLLAAGIVLWKYVFHR